MSGQIFYKIHIFKRYNNTKHHTTQYKPSAINKKKKKRKENFTRRLQSHENNR
jgi:hypothetical protein